MLKPLGKKLEVKEAKPSQIVVSIVNGKTVYSDADTGKIINVDKERFTPAYEVFNNTKASIILSSIAQGRTLIESLEDGSVSKATFSSWLMTNDEFSSALDRARSTRAQLAHEKFHSIASNELLSELPDEDEDITKHMKKLSIIERRQKILGVQKKEDNPNRFSDKDMTQSMAASVAISIDPEIITKMQAQFKTNLTSDGELDLEDSNKKLSEIIDADFKEIERE